MGLRWLPLLLAPLLAAVPSLSEGGPASSPASEYLIRTQVQGNRYVLFVQNEKNASDARKKGWQAFVAERLPGVSAETVTPLPYDRAFGVDLDSAFAGLRRFLAAPSLGATGREFLGGGAGTNLFQRAAKAPSVEESGVFRTPDAWIIWNPPTKAFSGNGEARRLIQRAECGAGAGDGVWFVSRTELLDHWTSLVKNGSTKQVFEEVETINDSGRFRQAGGEVWSETVSGYLRKTPALWPKLSFENRTGRKGTVFIRGTNVKKDTPPSGSVVEPPFPYREGDPDQRRFEWMFVPSDSGLCTNDFEWRTAQWRRVDWQGGDLRSETEIEIADADVVLRDLPFLPLDGKAFPFPYMRESVGPSNLQVRVLYENETVPTNAPLVTKPTFRAELQPHRKIRTIALECPAFFLASTNQLGGRELCRGQTLSVASVAPLPWPDLRFSNPTNLPVSHSLSFRDENDDSLPGIADVVIKVPPKEGRAADLGPAFSALPLQTLRLHVTSSGTNADRSESDFVLRRGDGPRTLSPAPRFRELAWVEKENRIAAILDYQARIEGVYGSEKSPEALAEDLLDLFGSRSSDGTNPGGAFWPIYDHLRRCEDENCPRCRDFRTALGAFAEAYSIPKTGPTAIVLQSYRECLEDSDRAAEAPDLLVAFAGKLATAHFEEKAVSAATDEEKGKGGSSR